MSNSLWSHGLQHSRLPCPLPTPGVCSNSCPLSGDAIQPSHPLSSPLLLCSIFRSIRVFSTVSSSHQVAKVLNHSSTLKIYGWWGEVNWNTYYMKKKKDSGSQCLRALWRSFLNEWTDLELMQKPRGGSPSWKPHSICSVWCEVMYNT